MRHRDASRVDAPAPDGRTGAVFCARTRLACSCTGLGLCPLIPRMPAGPPVNAARACRRDCRDTLCSASLEFERQSTGTARVVTMRFAIFALAPVAMADAPPAATPSSPSNSPGGPARTRPPDAPRVPLPEAPPLRAGPGIRSPASALHFPLCSTSACGSCAASTRPSDFTPARVRRMGKGASSTGSRGSSPSLPSRPSAPSTIDPRACAERTCPPAAADPRSTASRASSSDAPSPPGTGAMAGIPAAVAARRCIAVATRRASCSRAASCTLSSSAARIKDGPSRAPNALLVETVAVRRRKPRLAALFPTTSS